jgi:hypothetical protein
MEIDLAALRLGPEKEQEVKAALTPLIRGLELDFKFPPELDIAEARIELQVIVEEVPIRLIIPFNLKTVIGEPYETKSRKQGFPPSDATAHSLT